MVGHVSAVIRRGVSGFRFSSSELRFAEDRFLAPSAILRLSDSEENRSVAEAGRGATSSAASSRFVSRPWWRSRRNRLGETCGRSPRSRSVVAGMRTLSFPPSAQSRRRERNEPSRSRIRRCPVSAARSMQGARSSRTCRGRAHGFLVSTTERGCRRSGEGTGDVAAESLRADGWSASTALRRASSETAGTGRRPAEMGCRRVDPASRYVVESVGRDDVVYADAERKVLRPGVQSSADARPRVPPWRPEPSSRGVGVPVGRAGRIRAPVAHHLRAHAIPFPLDGFLARRRGSPGYARGRFAAQPVARRERGPWIGARRISALGPHGRRQTDRTDSGGNRRWSPGDGFISCFSRS